MKAVRIISLIARVALMVTMLLGVLYWIAQIPFLNAFLSILARIGFTYIHESLGIVGVSFLFVMALIALFTRGIRLLGTGSIIYALLVPALGLTQSQIFVGNLHWLIQAIHLLVGIGAMYLARDIEKRYLHLKQKDNREFPSEVSTVQVAQ